ncbi:MAG: hypothetical protein NZ578_01875 [Candidatus Binatia bacterium]|nr:hypothetical protein [Candidatus Binatia bacterium]
MPLAPQSPTVERMVATIDALCDFLTEPRCRQCEVLGICLRRLAEDVSQQSPSSRAVLRALRRANTFAVAYRRFGCRRCLPAEIFAAYLTPGEAVPQAGHDGLPPLSWAAGEQDIHW